MKRDTINNRPWFKMYVDLVLDDDRLGDLPCEYFKIFLQVYALCSRHGEGAFLGKSTRQLAKRLAFSTELMEGALAAIEQAGLIEILPLGLRLTGWDHEQPEMSDAERQRRIRAGKASKYHRLS